MRERYKVHRRWWFPIAIEVWQYVGDGEHWKKGYYETWTRRGIFFRRKTAEQYCEWLRARSTP